MLQTKECQAAIQFDEERYEFWFARDLQILLGYTQWRNFLEVVNKAKIACQTSGQEIEDHFADVSKMIEVGKGANRPIDDICCSRYACYLITQNGDSRKKPIAFGQTYFALQTRRQEIADQALAPQSEDEKRVFLRNQIKEHNKYLSSAANNLSLDLNYNAAKS